MANKFISGTLILTLSGFVVKAIGSINWIILSRILGGEGIGIYQMAFPIYLLALDISSAGLPIAISIITAEKVAKQDYFGAQRIFHVSLSMLCTTALFLSILMFFGSSFLIDEHIIRESRATGHCLGIFYWEPECHPGQYKLGAFTSDGRPTVIMEAFSE